MIGIAVCSIQILVIGLATEWISRRVLARAPQLAARLLVSGIAVCCLAVLLSVAGAPRLFEWSNQSAVVQINSPSNFGSSSEKPAHAAGQLRWEFVTPSSLLHRFAQFKAARPATEAGVFLSIQLILLLVLALALFRCALATVGVLRLHLKSLDCDDPQLNARLHLLAARSAQIARGTKNPNIRFSTAIGAPCVCWIQPSTIYVPCEFATWSELERDTALAHELQHIARRDAAWRFAAELLLCSFGIHPVACLLRKKLVMAQELATDRLAALLLPQPDHYRQGLSMLALRMDSEVARRKESNGKPPLFFEVSVSTNSMVRRIKMLNSPKKVPSWKHFVSWATLAVISIGSLAWTARADDPVRVASRNKATVAASQYFQRGKVALIDELGNQPGYFAIRPRALAEQECWTKLWKVAMANVESELNIDLTAQGLGMGQVEVIQSNFEPFVRVIPAEAREADDKRFTAGSSASAIQIDVAEDVDWYQFWKTIENSGIVEKSGVTTEVEKTREMLEEHFVDVARSSRLRLFSSSEGDADPDLAGLTELVDGGILVASCLVPLKGIQSMKPELREGDDPLQAYPWVSQTQAIALGVDITEDGTHIVRFAVLPESSQDVDAVKAQLNKCFELCAQTIQAASWLDQSPQLKELGETVSHITKAGAIKTVDLPNHRNALQIELPLSAELVAALLESMAQG